MSKEILKVALQQPEKVASSLAKSLLSAAGSGLGAAGTFKLLSALRPELAEAALWGGVGAGGVLGHDVAKHLANKAKVAAWAKKKAAMEKPFKTEYSLVKEANFLNVLRSISKQKKLEKALKVGLGTVGAGAGGLGGYGLIHAIAPGGFTRHAIMDTTPLIGGGIALGGLASAYAGEGIGKGINFIRNPKAYRARNTMTEALSNLTKTSSLSRAAKGAIGLPLGVMGAAALAPRHLFGDIGHLISGGAGKLADPTVGQKITEVLAGTGSRIAFNPHMNTDVAMLLGTAGLSGLGAGAGKLSEEVIPVAKKSIMDNPTARKAALAAALFPWSLAIGGGAYLLGKNNSDS